MDVPPGNNIPISVTAVAVPSAGGKKVTSDLNSGVERKNADIKDQIKMTMEHDIITAFLSQRKRRNLIT